VMLDSARRKTPVPALARWLPGLGIAATLAANVAHGSGHGLAGSRAGRLVRAAHDGDPQFPGSGGRRARTGRDADPLQERAAELFAGQLAADRVPSVRAIRAQLRVGQPRAQRLRDYLATGAARRAELSAT